MLIIIIMQALLYGELGDKPSTLWHAKDQMLLHLYNLLQIMKTGGSTVTGLDLFFNLGFSWDFGVIFVGCALTHR